MKMFFVSVLIEMAPFIQRTMSSRRKGFEKISSYYSFHTLKEVGFKQIQTDIINIFW